MKTTGSIERYARHDVPFVAEALLPLIKQFKIAMMTGSIGAGKTTIVSQLVAALGSTDEVSSPTYAYVNTYQLPTGKRLHHFDLYRLVTVESFFELGFDELIKDPQAYVIIEWPELVAPVYQTALQIEVLYQSPDTRSLMYAAKDAHEKSA